jgi:hypothetical protein
MLAESVQGNDYYSDDYQGYQTVLYWPVIHYPVKDKSETYSMELSSTDVDFNADLVQTVQSLVAEFDLEGRGYHLIVNGGEYQEVGQLHFHLISEAE